MERYAPRHDPRALTFLQMAVCFVGFSVIAGASGQLEVPRGATVWGALIVTGVFAGALGYLVATWVQARTTAARAALVFTLEAPFAALFGVLARRRAPRPAGWTGCAVMLTGIVLAEPAAATSCAGSFRAGRPHSLPPDPGLRSALMSRLPRAAPRDGHVSVQRHRGLDEPAPRARARSATGRRSRSISVSSERRAPSAVGVRSTRRATRSSSPSRTRRTPSRPPQQRSARSPRTRGRTAAQLRARIGLHTGQASVAGFPLRGPLGASRRACVRPPRPGPGAAVAGDGRRPRGRRPRRAPVARARASRAQGLRPSGGAAPARRARAAEQVCPTEDETVASAVSPARAGGRRGSCPGRGLLRSFCSRAAASATMTIGPTSVGVIDPKTNRVVDEIDLGTKASLIAAGEGFVWLADRDTSTLFKIDPETREIVRRTAIGAGDIPTGIAVGEGSVWLAVIRDRVSVVLELGPELGNLRRESSSGAHAVLPFCRGVRCSPSATAPSGRSSARSGRGLADRSRDRPGLTCSPRDSTRARSRSGGSGLARRQQRRDEDGSHDGATLAVDSRGRGRRSSRRRSPSGRGPCGSLAAPSRSCCGSGRRRTRSRTRSPLEPALRGVAVGEGAVWVANSVDGTVSRVDPGEHATTIALGAPPRGVVAAYGSIWTSPGEPVR